MNRTDRYRGPSNFSSGPSSEASHDGDPKPMTRSGETNPSSDPEPAEGSGGTRRHGSISRRAFLGWTAAGGAAAAAIAVAIETEANPSHPKVAGASAPAHTHRTAAGRQRDAVRFLHVDGVILPVSPAIVAENRRTGAAWWVTSAQDAGAIEGFADQVSAQVGDTVTLRVSTAAPTFHVEAFRMGYYQGIGARSVWTSVELPGVQQAPPFLIPPTNTIECQWTPSLDVTIDDSWPPGSYLLKLIGATGEQGFIPLCVRDDTSKASIMIMHSVTTWQAYNRWGGYSLYYGNRNGALTYTQQPGDGTYDDRARIVSFDRPYNRDWASGAADFVGNEFPVVFHAEQLGLDVSYWTDIDLHRRADLLANHRALLSLGHDEYWSSPMRAGVESAVQQGLNVGFLGANASYRQIRLQPSSLGSDRAVVCYKSAAEDPMAAEDPALVTVNWDQAPVSNPESSMTGNTYQDIDAEADMVIADPTSWLLAGTGLTAGQHLPKAVQGEFDRFVAGPTSPATTDIVAHSPVANRHDNFSDVTWYTTIGGGGVLDTGNAHWVSQLADAPLIPSNVLPAPVAGVTPYLRRIMLNVYSVLGAAPAGATNPSTGAGRDALSQGPTSQVPTNNLA